LQIFYKLTGHMGNEELSQQPESCLHFWSRGTLCFKSKVLLRQIAEGNDDGGRNNFRYGGIQMKMFHKKADKNIVQDDADQNQHQVSEKLNASMQYRTRKNDITHQHKSRRKTNKERNDKGRYMWFE
jgi:hypothetical protein